MKAQMTSRLTRVGVFAIALVVGTFGLAQGTDTAQAADTQIIFSYSSTAPVPAPAIILNPGGQNRDVYVWAVGVDNATGVSGFTLAISFDEDKFGVFQEPNDNNGIGDDTWLESTNRQGACVVEQTTPQPGRIVGLCTTLDQPPPIGPTGDGLLGHVVVRPEPVMSSSAPLTLIASAEGVLGTKLVDAPVDPDDIQEIPITLINSTVVYMRCADNNGDGIVDLPNDILGVILRFQMTSSDPDWDDAFDLDLNGLIDLPNDILGTILQFQFKCFQ